MLVTADSIVLLVLSVVTNTQHHFLAARNRKEDRCGSLLLDLQHAGFSVDLMTVEVTYDRTLQNLAMLSIYQRV